MFVHSSRIQKQVEYMRSIGIDPNGACLAAGIDADETLNPEKTFTIEQYIAVLEYAVEKSGDNYYGLKIGKESHIAGTVGMMCASCKNLKEAFILGCKYFQIQGDFAKVEFLEDQNYPKIRYSIVPAWQLRSPETTRQEVDAMFSFLVTILKVNSNQSLSPLKINFTARKLEGSQIYEEVFGVVPNFERAHNEILFRERDLTIPMKAFNPETFELLRSHIELQLRKMKSEERLSERVRSILLSSLRYRFPDMESVASKLNMSSRTLQRQLSNEKTSFKTLLQDTRFDLAKQLISQRDLTISEISYMLGYSDLGNFSRSFKKYTGYSPQDYRNR